MNSEPFWYWVNERYKIFLKKEAGEPWPWTKDPIFQEYAFCNVFRQTDRVTRAFTKMIAEPYADHPNLWFMYAVARFINWPDTVQEIIDRTTLPDQWNPSYVERALDARAKRGEKVFTGAYVVDNGGSSEPKPTYITWKVLDPLFEGAKEWPCPFIDLQSTFNWFRKFKGCGPFMSYEIVTDLRHTDLLNGAGDIWTWANAGPGATRGLNRLQGRSLDVHPKPVQLLDEMQTLLRESSVYAKDLPAMELRDIEHSLCELDKYLRVWNKEGRPRAKYHLKK